MDFRTTIVPRVHLNGSSAVNLLAERELVGQAARKLLEALADGTPNARDFYPISDTAYTRAIAVHSARMSAIRDMVNAIQEEMLEIQEQVDARSR